MILSRRFAVFAAPFLAMALSLAASNAALAQEKKRVSEPKKLDAHVMSAGQLTPADFPKLAAQGVTLIVNNRPDNEEPGQLSSQEAAALAKANGMDYVYIPMTYASVTRADVDRFREVTKQSRGPVLAHCRSGARSSLLWAMGRVADGQMSVDEALAATKAAGYDLEAQRGVITKTLAP
jgi:uncharacterized protein (TIGR01244 family)